MKILGASAARPAVGYWHHHSGASVLPQRLGDGGSVLPDDCISKEWLSGP